MKMPSSNANAVICETTKGEIEIVLTPEWSPLGVERFRELIEAGHMSHMPLFRCVDNFLCQFGYKERKPGENEWPTILDDKPESVIARRFKRGYVSFAGNGKDSRNSHLFITLGESVSSLGREPWETPVGYVTESTLGTILKWTTSYGDMPPWGTGPDPGKIARQGGSDYLKQKFPNLDYINKCRLEKKDFKLEDVEATTKNPIVEFVLGPPLGKVVIELNPGWGVHGVQRLLDMVMTKYLDQARFFRVVPGFVVQFGLPGDPSRADEYGRLTDEPVVQSNVKGTITFATSGPDTRTTQLFINLGNNARLDNMGFSPIGRVIQGMEFIEKINAEYGEAPDQGMIRAKGNRYLHEKFPRLSYIEYARIVKRGIKESDGTTPGGAILRRNDNLPMKVQADIDIKILVAIFILIAIVFAAVSRRVFRQSLHKLS